MRGSPITRQGEVKEQGEAVRAFLKTAQKSNLDAQPYTALAGQQQGQGWETTIKYQTPRTLLCEELVNGRAPIFTTGADEQESGEG